VDFEKVKENFLVTDCKTCGSKRVNHTWSKLDFASMARGTGDLGKLLAQAYYEPLNHGHSTSEAIVSRLERSPSGEIGFRPGAQRDYADRAVQVAHAVMIEMLEIQAKHFDIPGLREKTERCAEAHVEIWSKREIAVDPEAS